MWWCWVLAAPHEPLPSNWAGQGLPHHHRQSRPPRGEALSHLLQESVPVTSCYQPWDILFTMPRDADILVNATGGAL